MMQRFTAQIPPWMRPDHPILRHTLGARQSISPRRRYTRIIGTAFVLVIFLVAGYVVASDVFRQNPFERPISQMLSDVLFWPMLVLQVTLQLSVMVMTIGTIGEEKRRQTWDSVKTTSSGAALTLRTRWSAVLFYRIRGFVGLIIAVRLVLIGSLLLDLTAFRGEYLNYLTASITPAVPLAVGVLMLAAMMTASLLLPFTALGFNAATGLLISTFVQQRTYVALVQITLGAVRLGIIGLLLIAMTSFRVGGPLPGLDIGTWMMLLFFAAFVDWGVLFLYLGFYGAEVWAGVPYGIFIGLGLLVFVMVQAALTDAILAWAIRRAEGSE